jgi:carbamoyltransferase
MAGCPNAATVMVIDGRGSPWDELPENERTVIPCGQLAREKGIDREMPREIISTYTVHEGNVTPLEKHVSSYELSRVRIPGLDVFTSLGDMYGAVGEQIFGSHMDGPGKVMGLAPFGSPTIPIGDFYRIDAAGFEFQHTLCKRFHHDRRWPELHSEYAELAASVQVALEEAVLHICRGLRATARSEQLCYAGGVALNSVANERVIKEGGFEKVFILPASEDSGTAIGAAFYALRKLTGELKHPQQRTDSTGRTYSANEVAEQISVFPEVVKAHSGDVVASVCDLLLDGKIVAWYEGGSELGPRALGQRSIFCDPRSPKMKDFLNQRVKLRETFRPFAPMILEEDVSDWFDIQGRDTASPFMLRVLRFRADRAKEVPAVVHVDGSGRVQTIHKLFYPKLHALLTRWKRLTGVPILLNTSFNIAGEPIVETPRDALFCLCATGIDWCYLQGQLVTKEAGNWDLLDFVLVRNTLWYGLFDPRGWPNARHGAPYSQNTHELLSNDLGGEIVSAHAARIFEFTFTWQHLKVATRTLWGDVVHVIPSGFMRILDCIDGHRTASDIFCLVLDGERSSDVTENLAQFMKQLSVLRRIGAIDFVACNM